MAGILESIDSLLGTRLGLLVSDPRAAIQQMNQQAGAFNQASLLATQAERNAMRGIPVTPEQAAAKQYVDKVNEDLAMGFAGTINKPIYYHGTNKPFKEFANRLTYVTPDPLQASSYAGQIGANVRPVTLNINKTYTGGNVDAILETVKKADDYYPFSLSKIKEYIENKNPYAFGLPSVQKALKNLGYDSFLEIEGGVQQIGVFSPKNIKSVFEK